MLPGPQRTPLASALIRKALRIDIAPNPSDRAEINGLDGEDTHLGTNHSVVNVCNKM